MPIRAFFLFAASVFGGSVCLAQVSAAEIDPISNWPAPLYWQTSAVRSTPAHRGHARGEAAVMPAAATAPAPAVFVAMTPCRLVDTREGEPPFGSPAFYDGETRTIPMASSTTCTIPAGAVSYSLNIAAVPLRTIMRWLTAWDTGSPKPNAATLNDRAGLITSNSAVVPAGSNGSIDIFVTDATDVVIDINGYYAPPSGLPLTGTASAPALTFGDNATGLYSDTGGELSIATGGSGRLIVRSDGDLDITGNIRKNGSLFIHNAGASLNTAVGLSALTSNKGANNTALGVQALWLNTTGDTNTATGLRALANNTSGGHNQAYGAYSLETNTTGMSNTALGEYALDRNQTGSGNTAVGGQTLFDNLGDGNTAVGSVALFANSTGTLNTAVGAAALNQKVTGSGNIAIGAYAGSNLADGTNNIFIGNRGVALAETGVIRIGDSNQSQTFIAAVRGVTTANADAVPVYIDCSGQLGTTVSSRALKQDIHEMRDTTRTIMSLRPVEFRYRAHQLDSPLQYGLIAEEVAEVAPDLVARNSDGEIMTVHYEKVNAMLLNHVQKLTREKEALANFLGELEARVTELESRSK